ncbi:LacI family DNA-binding transcriptional regulator [Allomuricauda sp. SCSIO 65647]|uniref:LacI family DNA-binding transcriptional regulator n=1 Tax=Allomuricauda sp. SCSIO 65647 TaxID=2908843 RepID=UPI001F34C0DD|nr:LacI family DNA-binding transcriptional regulator [Muricauda sp. SCSIO 65647]UJH66247.1 LacI family transcriptional regulator [Muricauda sp. SCSIO 65647]
MKPKMTLKKIAKELDVSISTVSKALKDDKNVSQETREKIQAFAKFYNYRPNNIALSLKNQRTKTIGLIIPDIVHHFFAKVIAGAEQAANARGYIVVIGVSNESFEKEVINMEMMVNGSVDGFVVSIAKETLLLRDYHHLNEIISQGMPIVLFDRVVDEVECDKIIVDDKEAAKNATQQLIDDNRGNILLLTTLDHINIGRERTKGYLEALQQNQIETRSELVLKIQDNANEEEQEKVIEAHINRLMDGGTKIDAIFGVNEMYAVAALNVIRKLDLKVPEDLSVISFSNGVLSKYSRPKLTTVDQHGVDLGVASVNTLIDRLEEKVDEDAFFTKVIKTDLIKRESTF